MGLGIVDILQLSGFDSTKRTKLIRHISQYDRIDELIRNGWLEVYQSYQDKKVFHNVDQIVSFYGLSNNRAQFYGVYDVQGYVPANAGANIVGCPSIARWRNTCSFYYTLKRNRRFDDFR